MRLVGVEVEKLPTIGRRLQTNVCAFCVPGVQFFLFSEA